MKYFKSAVINSFVLMLTIGIYAAVHYSNPNNPKEYNVVTDYGAVPDNTTDSSTAFQNALNDAYNAGGGKIIVPAGSYKADDMSLEFTVSNRQIIIEGAGEGFASITGTGGSDDIFTFTANATPLETRLIISGLCLVANTDCNSIVINEHAHFTIERCRFISAGKAVHLKGALYGNIINCHFYSGKTGIAFEKTTIGCNVATVINTKFHGCTTVGAYLEGGAGITFITSTFEGCGTEGNKNTGGVRIGANIGTDGGYGMVSFNNCWWEANNGYDVNDLGSIHKKTVSFRDCLFFGSENGYYIDGGSTAPKLIMENCQMPNCNLEFEETQNIVAVLTGCVFADITGTAGNYIHRLATDYDSNFYPEWRSNVKTSGNVSGATYGSDGSISDVELLTIDD